MFDIFIFVLAISIGNLTAESKMSAPRPDTFQPNVEHNMEYVK